MTQWLDLFRNPPAEYRSVPLWVWNGEMTEARITEMLEQFAEQGMGGVFVHPRPGLINEYLSERWFELWAFALRECERLGLACNVYDENSYPSGFAGGHVPARIPHAMAQTLVPTLYEAPPLRPHGELLGRYRLRDGRAEALGAGADLHEAMLESPILTIELRRQVGTPWTAWFPYVDQTRPEVAREFIATTYEPYRARFGDAFGRTIKAFFTDEPHLASAGSGASYGGFPFSRFIAAEFAREHGYDPIPRLADLFFDQEGCAATRFDYWSTVQRLWLHNFLEPLYEWCGRHGVAFTGHFMEHDWPAPFVSPDCMEAYRFEHMPGIDLLAPQYNFDAPETTPQMLLTVRELNSAANQLGQRRRFCEAHGVGGYEAGFEKFKRLADFLIAHGVNYLDEHLAFQTIAGSRKYDHPQTFSDHSPWWGDYRWLNDHQARLMALTSQGRQVNRVLVLHPTTSGWLRANIMPLPHLERGFAGPDVNDIRADQGALLQALADAQIDFDLGNEGLLRELARVENGRFHVGECAYQILVVPARMDNWTAATLDRMAEWLEAGGRVLALGTPPAMVDGRPDPRPAELSAAAAWELLEDRAALIARLRELVPPYIAMADGQPLPPLVAHQMRELPNGWRVHLVVNTGTQPVDGLVRVAGSTLQALDTFSGSVGTAPFVEDNGYVVAPLALDRAGHAVWATSDDQTTPVVRFDPEVAETVVIERFDAAELTERNVLMLDFCDLAVGPHRHEGLYVTRANRALWQAQGFDQDVWDRSVQFRRNFLDMSFGDGTGFEAVYRFTIDAAHLDAIRAAGPVELAIERPELYTVTLNGVAIDVASGRRWFDETIRAAPIGNAVRPGTNEIRLRAERFNILCELDRVYVLGTFCLRPAAPGFRMVEPCEPPLGDWVGLGLPFYNGRVRYQTTFELAQRADALRVCVPQWAGAAIQVELDGAMMGYVAFPPYALDVPGPCAEGTHRLMLEVIGTPRNLLGPHFAEGSGWPPGPGAWDVVPDRPAAGADYQFVPQGLLGPVRIQALAE